MSTAFSDCLLKTWDNTLSLVADSDWRQASSRLNETIALAGLAGSEGQVSLEANVIVYASLQQKFGQLAQAERGLQSLPEAASAEAFALRDVIRSRMLSQAGDFAAAQEAASYLLHLGLSKVGSDPAIEHIRDSVTSLAWRNAMCAGVNGEKELSRYWFSFHAERSLDYHSSQTANNAVFRALVSLSGETPDLSVIYESNRQAVRGYLNGDLSTSGVLYLSAAKSLINPLMLESVLFARHGQRYLALTQAIIARRLLEYAQVSPKSEGIAELTETLTSHDDSVYISVLKAPDDGPSRLFASLRGYFTDDNALRMAIGEGWEHFEAFIHSRDYGRLFLRESMATA